MNQILSAIGVYYIVSEIFSYLMRRFWKIDHTGENSIIERKPIKYISEGLELPYPFHVEYKVIVKAMEKSWIHDNEHQELVNENHDAPILDREILVPEKRQLTYTFKHFFLAEAYLKEQKEHLEYLN